MNVLNVILDGVITNMKNYKWYLNDIKKVKKNNMNVFSCFSCCGGSSMGYKLSGYNIVGNCEIDEKINNTYVKNHHPRFNFNMDIRDFVLLDNYPDELYNLDILDGSPPCTSFSIAGKREKDWGKKKVFREGGKKQKLDDLFLPFIELGSKLKPKVIIAENVKGMLLGKAKGYCNLILKEYKKAGYKTQIFLLNSATMGVPQKRERVFFISFREDLNYKPLILNFNEKPIKFGEYRSKSGIDINKTTESYKLLQHLTPTDRKLSDINKRIYNKTSRFTDLIIKDSDVVNTVTSGGYLYRYYDRKRFSNQDIILSQTFPLDFDFNGLDVKYVCGMSVPPIMMQRISEQVYLQWLKN